MKTYIRTEDWLDFFHKPKVKSRMLISFLISSFLVILWCLCFLFTSTTQEVYGRFHTLRMQWQMQEKADHNGWQSALSGLHGVYDVHSLGHGQRYFLGVTFDASELDAQTLTLRVQALLPASSEIKASRVLVTLPSRPGLFDGYSRLEALNDAHMQILDEAQDWLSSARQESEESGWILEVDSEKRRNRIIEPEDIEKALQQLLAPRPPLPEKSASGGVMPSYWSGRPLSEEQKVERILHAVLHQGQTSFPLMEIAELRKGEGSPSKVVPSSHEILQRNKEHPHWRIFWSRSEMAALAFFILCAFLVGMGVERSVYFLSLFTCFAFFGLFTLCHNLILWSKDATFTLMPLHVLIASVFVFSATFGQMLGRFRRKSFVYLTPCLACFLLIFVFLHWHWPSANTQSSQGAFSQRLEMLSRKQAKKPLSHGSHYPSSVAKTLEIEGITLKEKKSASAEIAKLPLAFYRRGMAVSKEQFDDYKNVFRTPRSLFLFCVVGITCFLLLLLHPFQVKLIVPILATFVLSALFLFILEKWDAFRSETHISLGHGELPSFSKHLLFPLLFFSFVTYLNTDSRARSLLRVQKAEEQALPLADGYFRRVAVMLLAAFGLLWPLALLFDPFVKSLLLLAFAFGVLFFSPGLCVRLSTLLARAYHYNCLCRKVRKMRSLYLAASLLFALPTSGFLAWPQTAHASQYPVAECEGPLVQVMPTYLLPRPGEPLSERPEMALHLLSLIPCSQETREGQKEIEALIAKSLSQNLSLPATLEEMRKLFLRVSHKETKEKRVFLFVTEFFDNLSLFLWEVSPGRDPILLKLTAKKDTWPRTLEGLSPRFQSRGDSFFHAIEESTGSKKVRLLFKASEDPSPVTSRLISEMEASLSSRYSHPLPPKMLEPRSFFRIARSDEAADASLSFEIETRDTEIFVRIVATKGSKEKKVWLTGSVASLPEWENKLYETSRDALLDIEGISDYMLMVGPEFQWDLTSSIAGFVLAIRHNKGELSLTGRLRVAKPHWVDTCERRPMSADFGLTPAWLFWQTEALSLEAGPTLGLGVMDGTFVPRSQCRGKTTPSTYILGQYGGSFQALYTPLERLSLLSRVSAEGLGLFPLQEKADSKVRSRRWLSFSIGLGIGF
jgi:hypothetical protein